MTLGQLWVDDEIGGDGLEGFDHFLEHVAGDLRLCGPIRAGAAKAFPDAAERWHLLATLDFLGQLAGLVQAMHDDLLHLVEIFLRDPALGEQPLGVELADGLVLGDFACTSPAG